MNSYMSEPSRARDSRYYASKDKCRYKSLGGSNGFAGIQSSTRS